MKASKWIVLTTTALAFAACNNDENLTNDGPVAAQIRAEIGNAVSTRATKTSFVNGNEIGVSVVSVENDGKTTGTNVKYTYNNGSFSTGAPIYFQDTEEVTFRAYYPFTGTSGTTVGTVEGNTRDQTQYQTFDYLFAVGAKASKTNPTVNFNSDDTNFKHCMSQITIQFKNGNDTQVSNLTGYTLSSFVMTGTFDTENGTAKVDEISTQASEVTKEDLIIDLSGETITGEEYSNSVILFPQPVERGVFTLTLTLEGEKYSAKLTLPNSKTTLESGNNYIFPVKINKTGLEVGEATIAGWTESTATEGTAEMTE